MQFPTSAESAALDALLVWEMFSNIPGFKEEFREPGVTPEPREELKPEYATKPAADWGVDVVQRTGNHQASYDPDIELGSEDYERKKRMGIYGGF